MKRTIAALLAALSLAALPAQAEIWFKDGYTLHRDPLCDLSTFSLESCFEQTLSLTPEEAHTQYYQTCQHCSCFASADDQDVWYFNPDGGRHLHRDPECPSVSVKYRPMLIKTDQPDAPETPCNICGGAGQLAYLLSPAVWNESPERLAKLLPGIWTLPSENAISQVRAIEIGKAEALKYSDKSIHTAFALHYDYAPGGLTRELRESWYVVVTTPLQHPVCVVHIDALTGEVYSTHLSQEYSNPTPAEMTGAQLEIIWDNVNIRQTPGGEILTRLHTGDTLPLKGEVRQGLGLWYCVDVPGYGEGYVSSMYSQIVHNGRLRGDASPLTENLLAYYADLRRFQIEQGYLGPDEEGSFVITQDQTIPQEAHKVNIVLLMFEHSLLADPEDYALLLNPDCTNAEKELVARRILTTHYGEDDLFHLFTSADVAMPGIRSEDWHSPEVPTSAERKQLDAVRQGVDKEYQ